MNKAVVHILIQVFLWVIYFHLFEVNSRVELLGHRVGIYTTKQCSNVTIFTLTSIKYMRVPVAPHPHQHLILSVFLITAIPVI